MGLFKRASWHSGLTYKNTCPQCNTTITYKDDKLDFRPWFADGFVYCPTCQKPLRHSESLAIEQRPEKQVDLTTSDENIVCHNCGKQLAKEDNFCSNCGTKKS